MAKEIYVVLNVSAGNIIDRDTKEPVVWANVEVVNSHVTDNGRDGNVSYGSPRVKLNLVDRDTGLPNLQLAKRLQHAKCFLQPVEFEGTLGIVKQKGEEKMSFIIHDALLEAKPAAKAV